MKFDSAMLKKNLGKLADASKSIAKKTVELGKEGGALASQKLEEYSQRSQKAEDIASSPSRIKQLEKYANIIEECIDNEEKDKIQKCMFVLEFELLYDQVIDENEEIESICDIEDIGSLKEYYEYVIETYEDKLYPMREEIRANIETLKERYEGIIYGSSNKVQQILGTSISDREFVFISFEILYKAKIWNNERQYENKGSYLIKRAAKGTKNIVMNAMVSAQQSALNNMDRQMKEQKRNIDYMTCEEYERYENNAAILEEKKVQVQEMKGYIESEKSSISESPRISKLSGVSIDELELMRTNLKL